MRIEFPFLFNFAASHSGSGYKRLHEYARWFDGNGGTTFAIGRIVGRPELYYACACRCRATVVGAFGYKARGESLALIRGSGSAGR